MCLLLLQHGMTCFVDILLSPALFLRETKEDWMWGRWQFVRERLCSGYNIEDNLKRGRREGGRGEDIKEEKEGKEGEEDLRSI